MTWTSSLSGTLLTFKIYLLVWHVVNKQDIGNHVFQPSWSNAISYDLSFLYYFSSVNCCNYINIICTSTELYFFGFQSKISLLHDAVNSGRLEELQHLLDEEPEKKKKLVLAKDESGVGLLHKAVYYDLKDIYKWLIEKFPQTVSMRDSVSNYLS